MNIFREFFYRPKRSDKSLLARFYFADLNLNTVASELDSFDGRKDPDRCSCLVNRLRACQDKLLHITNKMMEEIEPGTCQRQRQFRVKFPDDIMTDSLAGQLWFGAECLAAGSSIMNKERESEAMRPLAKAVVKSLDKVRALLREQCLSPQPEYSEKIRENLKIFDRLFAEFEFSYVQCMVHVKTEKEYMLHQDLIVLFSETLQRAIRNEMITQDMVDFYEPSLMFAIPRLAIVNGLLISPKGPLNVDRSSSDFPDLFLPFKNLLKKIRELLLTLAAHEVLVLEMLLCQAEEPANITVKLKEVERMLETKAKSAEGQVQADKLTEKLISSPTCDSGAAGAAAASMHSPEDSAGVVGGILEEVIKNVVQLEKDPVKEEEIVIVREEQASSTETTSVPEPREVEIDCAGPEIKVSPRRRVRSSREQSSSSGPAQGTSSSSSSSTAATSSKCGQETAAAPSSYSPRPKQRLRRHNAKRDSKRIPLRYQKDRRAKFKSTEDLLHRLYVCISGAADQLQSNYAGDFRAILKNVFVMNTSQDDDEDEEEVDGSVAGAVGGVGAGGGGDDSRHLLASSEDATPSPLHSDTPPVPGQDEEDDDYDGDSSLSGSRRSSLRVPRPPPTSQSLPNEMFTHPGVATDALQQEMSNYLIQEQLRSCSSNDDLEGAASTPPAGTSSGEAAATNGQAYAANLDMVAQAQAMDSDGEGLESTIARTMPQDVFYQPEPRLLDIASGDAEGEGEGGRADGLGSVSSVPDEDGILSPPAWIPDEDAPNCMGCHIPFTLFRRRHHCRSCGQVFCNRCSSHSLALPQYGIEVPVRVCNRCHIIYQYPDIMARQAQQQQQQQLLDQQHEQQQQHQQRQQEQPGTPGSVTDGDGQQQQGVGRSPWARNFGMVS